MMKFKIVTLSLLLMVLSHLQAQEETVWQSELEKPVTWTHLTKKDILLVGTKDWRITAFRASDGSKLWENDFFRGTMGMGQKGDFQMDGISESKMAGNFRYYCRPMEDEELQDYALLFNGNPAAKRGRWGIINILSGDYVDLSKLEINQIYVKNMEYVKQDMAYVEPLQAVLVAGFDSKSGYKEKDAIVKTMMIDVKGMKTRWTINEYVKPSSIKYIDADNNMIAHSGYDMVKLNTQTGDIMWRVKGMDGELYATDHGYLIYKVENKYETNGNTIQKSNERYGFVPSEIQRLALVSEDGKVVWENSTEFKKDGAIGYVFMGKTDDKFYYFQKEKKGGFFKAVDTKTGKEIFSVLDKKVKRFPYLQSTDEGFLMSTEKVIRLLSYEDGSEKWERKADGEIGFTEAPGGVLVVQDIKNGVRKGLFAIDLKNGKELWREKLENASIEYVLPGGVMYNYKGKKERTYVNMLDPKTGKNKWSKDLIYSSRFVFNDEGKMIRPSGASLVEIDVDNATVNELSKELEFEESEYPTALKMLSNGYFIGADQNMALIDFDGNLVYHTYLASPKEAGWKQALNVTAGLMAVAAGAAGSMQASYNYNMGYSSYSTANSQYKAGQQAAAAGASIIGETLRKRFKATTATDQYYFILTRDAEVNGKKSMGISKVKIADGTVESAIHLKDRAPVYTFDPIKGNLYIRTDNKQMTCYKF